LSRLVRNLRIIAVPVVLLFQRIMIVVGFLFAVDWWGLIGFEGRGGGGTGGSGIAGFNRKIG
jgi:hypothetical protein